jgi:hypothetical protein
MRWALPLEIGAGIAGIILWPGSNFIAKEFYDESADLSQGCRH